MVTVRIRHIPVALLASLFFLLVIAWLMYGRSLAFGYVWDDTELFVNSTRFREVHSWSDWWAAVSAPVLPTTTYFRPLTLSTFVLQFAVWGISPKAAHIFNVLLFLCNVALVFVLASCVFGKSAGRFWGGFLPAFIVTFLYLIHPAQVESVAWVVGRFDLLVTFLSLICLIGSMLLDGRRSLIWYSLTLFLALLSKEMAVTLLVLVPLLRSVRGEGGSKTDWLYPVLGILVLLFYFALKWWSMGRLAHTDEQLVGGLSWVHRVAYVGQTLMFYLKMVFWPFSDINPQHAFDPMSMSSMGVLQGWGVLLFFVLFGVWALKRRSAPLLLLLAAFISLAPIANVVLLTIGGVIGCDRFLAFPLVFFSLAVVCLVRSCLAVVREGGRVTVVGIFLVWSALSVLNVWVTVPLWQSDLTLWRWAAEKHPDDLRGQFNLASAYYKIGDFDALQAHLDRSIRLGGDPTRFDVIRGAVLIRQGRELEGVRTIEKVMQTADLPHLKLLSAGVALSSVKADLRWYPKAVQVAFAYVSLSDGYRGLGMFDKALEAAEVVNFYQPELMVGSLERAYALYSLDRWDEAESAYARAYQVSSPADKLAAASGRANLLRWLCAAHSADVPRLCQRMRRGDVYVR